MVTSSHALKMLWDMDILGSSVDKEAIKVFLKSLGTQLRYIRNFSNIC